MKTKQIIEIIIDAIVTIFSIFRNREREKNRRASASRVKKPLNEESEEEETDKSIRDYEDD